MTGEGRKALLFFGGLIAVALVAGLVGARVIAAAGGPDVEIVSAIKATEKSGLELPVTGAPPLVLHRHFFERVLVDTDLAARRAGVVATLDAEGKLGPTKVSSLGFEQLAFTYEGGRWRPSDGWAPRLTAALGILEAHRRALEVADAAALARLYRVAEEDVRADEGLRRLWALRRRRVEAEAWYLRSERDEILVSEEYRHQGETPDRPVDERGTRRLVIRSDGGEFFFAAGLM